MAIYGGLTLKSIKQNGFSLIEVLVSLVILVVGLIGVFNLHIVSKQGSFESFQQTQASYYANDILNRMRLNVSELANYGSSTGTSYNGKSLIVPGKLCINGAVCNAAEMRQWDLYDWQKSFIGDAEVSQGDSVGGLPVPIACIFVDGNNVSVVMTWQSVRKMSSSDQAQSGNVKACGGTYDKKRIYEIETAIF
ncbi:type IV pilus modification protein PilV [Shewanella intestini]|uniref:Type IV pilus modification protein PilV n=1 Tax=Shewanella intestini TaxID=2017544 RepID=A0ABS5HYR5_9GAMM|nr:MULTISPECIES: type IV pilus modification protein PilV [Shewanella]MBR9726693.1 type IV pilus modification protein PilV [Shewanella intestini]MRG34741.1 type IV pilus modification protein PilV [Shewanella sp. XMDDZSB0408]